jgi:eukaryotic-like serine/threonine-protein kinase
MLVAGRFRLEHELGAGRAGISYRATDGATGETVVVKRLDLSRVREPKALELVERECSVLAQLRHPRIPRYVTHLREGEGLARRLFLVEGFVDGEDLERTLAGHRYSEEEILDVVEELLDILSYLHTLSPPVIHRDIKPMNVVRERNTGELHLVDFGAVRDRTMGDLGGSTITGTFGYMAPEQFAGDAVPASDLFAVGALAIRLATRTEPNRLLDATNRFHWRSHAALSAPMANFIDRLVAPHLDDRIQSVGEAREALARARAHEELAPVAHATGDLPGEAELQQLRQQLAARNHGRPKAARPTASDGQDYAKMIAIGLAAWAGLALSAWLAFGQDLTTQMGAVDASSPSVATGQ